MVEITRRATASIAILALVLGASFARVMAGEATSTSFSARDTAITQGGGESSSTSFGSFGVLGDVIAGDASSTNFLLKSGPLNFDSAAFASQNWHWYDDETNLTPTSSLANENIAPTNIINDNVIKLRLTVKEAAGIGQSGAKFKLQYSDTSDFSSGVGDLTEIGSCVPSSPWCYADGAGTDNAVIATSTLTDPDSCVGGVGNGCGTVNESGVSTSTFTHQGLAATEYEFTLKQRAAQTNTTYFFRAFDTLTNTPVPPNTGESYPSLVTGGTTLTFSVAGLSSGTTTEGIVTDATTTATAVNLGTLTLGTEIEAAQRLTVTTNAVSGYQIFAMTDQELMNQLTDTIPSVVATNAAPAGWGTACIATSTGCYGYHAGDDTLSGGSTRFSANDTYARFETSTREIAYSSVPTTSESTDVVFKTLVRPEQLAGTYQQSLTYIIVPVF